MNNGLLEIQKIVFAENEIIEIEQIRKSLRKDNNHVFLKKCHDWIEYHRSILILYNQAACCCYNLRQLLDDEYTQLSERLLESYFIL